MIHKLWTELTSLDPNSDVCIGFYFGQDVFEKKWRGNINLKSHQGGKWVETDIDLIQ